MTLDRFQQLHPDAVITTKWGPSIEGAQVTLEIEGKTCTITAPDHEQAWQLVYAKFAEGAMQDGPGPAAADPA